MVEEVSCIVEEGSFMVEERSFMVHKLQILSWKKFELWENSRCNPNKTKHLLRQGLTCRRESTHKYAIRRMLSRRLKPLV